MKRIHAIFLILIFTMIAPAIASAEWFIEPYAGAAYTRDADVDIDASGGGFTLNGKLKNIELDNSFMAGLRTGFWFESLPYIGVAVDAFYFRPDVKTQTATFTGTGSVTVGSEIVVTPGSSQAQLGNIDIYGVGFSADLMLRLPMGGTDPQSATVQPYILAGPAWILTIADDTVEPALGFKAGAGLALMISKNFGLFAEYRFLRFSPEGEVKSGNVTADLEADITTHAVIGGVSLRF